LKIRFLVSLSILTTQYRTTLFSTRDGKEDHLSGGTERRKPGRHTDNYRYDPKLFAKGCAPKTKIDYSVLLIQVSAFCYTIILKNYMDVFCQSSSKTYAYNIGFDEEALVGSVYQNCHMHTRRI
jgi:hypothetical protein